MKSLCILALTSVNANWSFGACPTSFPDIGIVDTTMDYETYMGGALKNSYGVGYPAADVTQ